MTAHEDDADTTEAPDLVLRLVLSDVEPISGHITLVGQSGTWPFRGWMDLIAAINTLRATTLAASPASGPSPSA